MDLAVEGGRPVRDTLLPYGRHSVDDSDIQAVTEVLRSDWLTTGPKIAEFEEAVAAYVGAKFAVVMSSGTAALHAAAFAANLKPGDEAITTPLTFAASANCVLYQGARPVFADVRSDTLNIDPAGIEAKVSSRTKALIPVDYAGQPVDMDEINDIADRRGLAVIEDASHALGGLYKDRSVGSLATMTVFSLHPVKQIATGEGGIVTTDDADLARKLRTFRNHGITSDARERQEGGSWYYEMELLGYNYRITDFQCALGTSQLKKLPEWLARRRAIAARYTAEFNRVSGIIPPSTLVDRESAWHLYVIRLKLNDLRVGRDKVFRALRAENIGVNVHYIPVPWHPYYQRLGYERGQQPIAEDAYESMISLPMFAAMSDKDVADVVEAVNKVVSAYRR